MAGGSRTRAKRTVKKSVAFAEGGAVSQSQDAPEILGGGGDLPQHHKGRDPGEPNRFKHLLDPIRDLALNWNVDIADQLENYLNELDMIEISFDGGETTLNFAEAALLIQGSTCVYSRKVEYLYKLVFQVLDIIADREKKAAAVERGGDHDEDLEFEADPEFISLDDIKEAKSSAIDMVETDEYDDRKKDSTVVCRSPVLLMNINLDGAVDDEDPNKDFRLASAAVHSSGALLLESRFTHLLDCNLESIVSDTPASKFENPEMMRDADFSPMNGSTEGGAAEGPAEDLPVEDGVPNDDAADEGGVPDYGGEDDDDWDAFQEPLPEGSVELPRSEAAGDKIHHKAASSNNPWVMLDPHDSSGAHPRPFKRGKTSRKPRGGALVATEPRSNPMAYQTRSVQLPYFQEFMPYFIQQRNKVLADKLAQAKLRREQEAPTAEELEYMALQVDLDDDYDGEDPPYVDQDHGEPAADMGGNAGGWDDGAGGGDDDDLPPMMGGDDDAAYGTPGVKKQGLDWRERAVAYEDMCRKYVEKYLKGVENFIQASGLEARVNDWQAKLEPKLQEEESREAFDIHTYGDKVKQLVSKRSTENEVPFGVAVEGMQKYDICRAFLATLQLANDGNVELSLKAAHDSSSLHLKLVHDEDMHASMVHSYVAPSILSARKKKQKGTGYTTGLQDVISRMPDLIEQRMKEEDAGGEAIEGEDQDEKQVGVGTQASQMLTQDKKGKRAGEGGVGGVKGRRTNKENVPAQ